jgi:uncharacterized membrane protein (DUF4010 family)
VDVYDPFISLGLAFAVGLLIGTEREQSAIASEKPEGAFFGGARTFPLFAILGALASLIARQAGIWVVLITFLGVLGFVAISYIYDVTKDGDRGLTSEVALVLTFLLGVFAMTQGIIEPLRSKVFFVLATAVVVTLLLSVKSPLHRFAAKTTQGDILATMKFLVVAVVLLPLLPNATFGPMDVLNPFKIGLMIVLIGGVSFVGYVAMRVLGPGRGLSVTGLVGGLASSTAVTLTFSKRAKETPELAPACALAIILASTVMCVRIIIVVAAINRSLVTSVAIPMAAMTVGSLAACAWLYREAKRRTHKEGEQEGAHVELTNPFELGSAIKLGAIFAIVLFISKAATTYAGSSGTYVAGLLAGTTDVDALTISMANLASNGLAADVAVTTILIGVASNTMVKGGIALALGGLALGKRVILAYTVSAVGGALGVLWLWLN